jgi:hypothetical protein
MFHRGSKFVRESAMCDQDHADHDRTEVSQSANGQADRRTSGQANPKAFDVTIVLYQASYA